MALLAILLVSLLTAITGGKNTNTAFACSCIGRSVSDYIDESSSTFVGKVEDLSDRLITGGHYVEFGGVSKVWGEWTNDAPSDGKVTVWTRSLGLGDCGYPFKEGQEYLVYTERHEVNNVLEVEMCKGTKPIDAAQVDLQVLGAGTDPANMAGATGEQATVIGSNPLGYLMLLVIGLPIAAVAMVSFWILRKRGLIH